MKQVYITAIIFLLGCSSSFSQWDTLSTGVESNFFATHFINEDMGLAVGQNATILRTNNGGETWLSADIPLEYDGNLRDVFYSSDNTVYAVGKALSNDSAQLLKSTDGGGNWFLHGPQIPFDYEAVYFTSDLQGYVTGMPSVGGTCSGFNCSMYHIKTSDGGASGNIGMEVFSGRSIDIIGNAIHFPTDSVGYMVGAAAAVIKTTDKGTSWNGISWITGPSADDLQLNDVFFINEDTGFIVGEKVSNGNGFIRQTLDGGDSWSTIYNSSKKLRGIDFLNDETGVVVGKSGLVLVTYDMGGFWYEEETNATTTLNDIFIASDTVAYAVGNQGVIIKREGAFVAPPFEVSFEINRDDTLCLDTTNPEIILVNFNNTSILADSFVWKDALGAVLSTNTNYMKNFDEIGEYQYNLVGCETGAVFRCDSASITIVVLDNQIADFELDNDTIYLGDTVFTNNTSNSSANVRWLLNDLVYSSVFDTFFVPSALGANEVKLVTLSGTCTDTSIMQSFVVLGNVSAAFSDNSEDTIEVGTTVAFVNESENATTYEWYINNNLISAFENLNYQFIEEGSFDVKLLSCQGSCNVSDSAKKTFVVVSDIVNGFSALDKRNLQFSLYPNPSEGTFIVDVANSNNVNLEVYNSFGQMMLFRNISDRKSTVDMRGMASGIYSVKVSTDNGSTLSKTLIIK